MAKGREGTRAEVGRDGVASRKHMALNEEDLHCGQGEKLRKQVETR